MTDLQSPTIGKIAAALVKAQSTMGVALKDTTGQIGQNKGYKYADLASVITAARDALALNDLAAIQRPMPSDKGVCVQTMLVHSSGEWITDGGLHLPLTKVDPQGAGMSITYARRYGLAAMLGIVQDDDDGAAATAAQNAARARALEIANSPKLTGAQAEVLEAISAACGYPGRDRSDALEEDYQTHLKTAIEFAVKQKVVTASDAEDVEAAGLKLDIAAVNAGLASEVAA